MAEPRARRPAADADADVIPLDRRARAGSRPDAVPESDARQERQPGSGPEAQSEAQSEDQPTVGTRAGSQAGSEAGSEAGRGQGQPAADAEPADAAASPWLSLVSAVGGLVRETLGPGRTAALLEAVDVVRDRLTGDYDVDEFGFDAELVDTVLAPALRPLYRTWFRVDVDGVDNIPDSGSALLVANHSGSFPLDAVMLQLAVHDEHPRQRHLRLLGADLLFSTPIAGAIARKGGSTLACAEDAARLLDSGQLVGVFPEGFKGVGKPFAERYKLQRFGRGGFVATALEAQVPIIPVSIVGAEETYPMLGNASTLARLLGVPYVPLTPTFPWLGLLGLVPLPSKWLIEFGAPIPTDLHPRSASDDPAIVFDLTEQVRETIQQSLYRLLHRRPAAFF